MAQPSGSVYIIVCGARIGVAVASNEEEEIVAVSTGCKEIACYLSLRHRTGFDVADLAPMQELQHALMDHLLGEPKLTKDEVDQKIAALFEAFTALEQKYDSGAY